MGDPLSPQITALEFRFHHALSRVTPEVAGRAAWEAEFNKTTQVLDVASPPGELPEPPLLPEVLDSDEILVDGPAACGCW